jgi:hypothetical protein
MALRPNKYRVGVERRDEYIELEWTTDLPTKPGLYKFFHENVKGIYRGSHWSSWEKIETSGDFVLVRVDDDVEKIQEYLERETRDGYKIHFFGPIPEPEPPF